MKAPYFYSTLSFLFTVFVLQAQDSNIQFYTRSKLMQSGQWDIKWFNNLYTEVLSVDDKKQTIRKPIANFFTSSLDLFTGLSQDAVWNIGIQLQYRSNTLNGLGVLEPFRLRDRPMQRHGLTRIAPAIKVAPFRSLNNFSIQSSFNIPLFDREVVDDVFLDQKGLVFGIGQFF